ncbi:MAG: hypothetical protein JWM68_3697 [Verrucomicrobiales bacterium]|nr:hypothetical protein [Verrucomicrobiales bacterium]
MEKSETHRLQQTLDTILPLLGGEGWGEDEDERSSNFSVPVLKVMARPHPSLLPRGEGAADQRRRLDCIFGVVPAFCRFHQNRLK